MNSEVLDQLVDSLCGEPAEVNAQSWQQRLPTIDKALWTTKPNTMRTLAQQLVRQGYARHALEFMANPLQEPSTAVQQLRAYALTSVGAPRTARGILLHLLESDPADIETLSLLGRTEKGLARVRSDNPAATGHWESALEHYNQAFALSGDPYPGINAATLLLRLGQRDEAEALANQVLAACSTGVSKNPEQSYWNLPTLAEAHLILGHIPEAKQYYEEAITKHGSDLSSMGSMTRQAREVLEILELPSSLLDESLRMPAVAIFSGHREDELSRDDPRFGDALLEPAKDKIRETLVHARIGAGFCGLASGADILFAELLIEMGIELHVVLPMDVPAYEQFSVGPDPSWRRRFHQALNHASTVTITSDLVEEQDTAILDYCNRVTLGLAKLHANELATELHGFALWDGQPGPPGGTSDTVALWQSKDIKVSAITPDSEAYAKVPAATFAQGHAKREVMSIIFADVVSYSRFSEHDIELYYTHILPAIAQLANKNQTPAIQQTFGDAFYFVYTEPHDAADAALALQELFDQADHLPQLTQDLRIRIALHAGPLLPCYDPIRQAQNYTGRHTSKAARVEPVAPENQILATQQFAALLAVNPRSHYEFAYAGQQALAKSYGSERLYILRANEISTRQVAKNLRSDRKQ